MEKFAFIIHPIELDDIYRKYNKLKYLPKYVVEKIVSRISPSQISQITNVRSQYNEGEGWFIGVPLTTKMMMSLETQKVLNKIIEAGRMGEKLGAKIIGLGAHTSVVGDAGITIANHLDIPVTTGNTYTVAAAYEATKEASRLLGRNMEENQVAILGANGSIGKVCAELVCRNGKKLTLVGRDFKKLTELSKILRAKYPHVRIDCTTIVKEGIAEAETVITVTSSIQEVIHPEYIKSGAVICDVARPRDVSKKVQEKRQDVLVIEGGVIEVPKEVKFNFNFGFPDGLAYACMAETMILALEKKYESFSIGREIQIEKVDEINRLAKKHGFKLAGLRSFERVIDEKYLEKIRANMKKAEEVK